MLPVFGACLIGDALARRIDSLGILLLTGLGLAALAICWERRVGARIHSQGVSALVLLSLGLLASMRVMAQAEGTPGRFVGEWRSLQESPELLGELVGLDERFETTRGMVRDGEWVELLAVEEPTPAARGPYGQDPAQMPGAVHKLLPDEIKRIAPASPTPAARLRRATETMRFAGLAKLRRLDSELTRGLAGALLFGDRSSIPRGVTDLFTRTGTRHALAVSGLHVALVASMWIWPLGALLAVIATRLGRASWVPSWFHRPHVWRVLLLALFVPLAGSGAPVVRAALALALAQVAGILPATGRLRFERRADSLSLWAFAAWVEWFADPASVTSISMQLSYIATLGLILLTPNISRGIRSYLPAGGQVQATNRSGRTRSPWLRMTAQKCVDFVLMGLTASIAANVATLPIAWSVFGEWSLAGPAATLAILPLLGMFLGLAWLWMACPVAPIERLLTWNAEAMTTLLRFFDQFPGTPLPLPNRPIELLACASGAAFLWACTRGTTRQVWFRLSAASWGVALLPWWRGATELELYVLDVGNGTATVVRAPGEPCWIFDAGSRDRPRVARGALAPLLRELDVGRVAVALSHADSDHAGALPWVIERYPPSLWLGALPAHIAERLPRDCAQFDIAQGRLQGHSGPPRQDGFSWALLRGMEAEGNEGSRSLELQFEDTNILLCGDAEGDGLSRQLLLGVIRGPYEVVLFPHHGSESAWMTPFLEATQPGEIWLSCSGKAQIAEELERRALTWRSTAVHGPLTRFW
ncbi:MAG: competence protein ComEC [Planctomycetota bacterium]